MKRALLACLALALPAHAADEVALTWTHASLSGPAADWNQPELRLSREIAPRARLEARVGEARRFGERDSYVAAGGSLPLGDTLTGAVEIVASPSHDVLSRDSAHLQLTASLGGGWNVAGGVRRARYDTATVRIGDLTVERYWGSRRAALTLFPSRSSTAGSALAARVAFAHYYGERDFLQLSAYGGEEADRPAGTGPVVRARVKGIGLDGRHGVAPGWWLTYGLGVADIGDVRHRTLSLGLLHRLP